jgi:hypothetical protein
MQVAIRHMDAGMADVKDAEGTVADAKAQSEGEKPDGIVSDAGKRIEALKKQIDHNWGKAPGLSKEEQNAAVERFNKAIDDLIEKGGLGGKLALWLLHWNAYGRVDNKLTIIWDPEASARVEARTGGVQGAAAKTKFIRLNPNNPSFIQQELIDRFSDEVKDATAAVVLAHELGHFLLNIDDPENVQVVENVVRTELCIVKKICGRKAVSGQDRAIMRKDSPRQA